MKFLIIPALLLSFGLGAEEYEPNDGRTTPGTFSSKVTDPDTVKTTTIEKEEIAPSSENKTGVQSSGFSTEDVNTSPNRAPSTDEEVIEGTALSNEDLSEDAVIKGQEEDELIEAQEAEEDEFEDSVDYSTMPEGTEIEPLEPDYE